MRYLGRVVKRRGIGYGAFVSGMIPVGLAETEQELSERAARFLKAELKRANVTYSELAERLKQHGLHTETEASIKAKLKRGTFAATFLLASLAALEMEGMRLEDL